ncbi:MAG TPA: hypothetical protein DIT48_08635 [Actinobacteria bacterium]|jgi:hypothetical protein|nr:hypothetical protein [Actinomycetota bacterium]
MRAREKGAGSSSLAVRVAFLSITVGGAVTALAAWSGAGGCAGPEVPGVAPDPVCFDLVRTLSERIGVATAVVTVIMVLTMVGLAKLGAAEARPR